MVLNYSDWAGSLMTWKAPQAIVSALDQEYSLGAKKNRKLFAQSTVEAKFIPTTTTINHALWLRKVLIDLHMDQKMSIEVMVDN